MPPILPPAMIPTDAEQLEAALQAALHNVALFNVRRHRGWLVSQPESIRIAATARPPDRVYRIVSDDEQDGRGVVVLLGLVLGYREGRPADVMVYVIGVKSGAGSMREPLAVTTDRLVDVTEEARAGKVRPAHDGRYALS